MIEQILYQMLGWSMIVFAIVFLWWAHGFSKETERMGEEVEERVKRCEKLTRNVPPSSKQEFNPGNWTATSAHPADPAREYGMLFHRGQGILVPPEVMQELGLKHGQSVDEETALRVASLNAGLALTRCGYSRAQEPQEMTKTGMTLLHEKMRSEQTYDFNNPAEVERFREQVRKLKEQFFIDANGKRIGEEPK